MATCERFLCLLLTRETLNLIWYSRRIVLRGRSMITVTVTEKTPLRVTSVNPRPRSNTVTMSESCQKTA